MKTKFTIKELANISDVSREVMEERLAELGLVRITDTGIYLTSESFQYVTYKETGVFWDAKVLILLSSFDKPLEKLQSFTNPLTIVEVDGKEYITSIGLRDYLNINEDILDTQCENSLYQLAIVKYKDVRMLSYLIPIAACAKLILDTHEVVAKLFLEFLAQEVTRIEDE